MTGLVVTDREDRSVAKQDGIIYLAMELIEGRSLQKMLRAPERI